MCVREREREIDRERVGKMRASVHGGIVRMMYWHTIFLLRSFKLKLCF